MPGREGDQYKSHPEKRFHISEDEFSRERVEFLKELHDKVTEEIPGINVGFTLFGSLSKGKELTAETARNSDIDAAIFIDSDDVEKKFDEIVKTNSGGAFGKMAKIRIPEQKVDVYTGIMTQELRAVREYVATRFGGLEQDRRFKKEASGGPLSPNIPYKKNLFIYAISMNGPRSIFQVVQDYYSAIQEKRSDDIRDREQMVSRFFHLDVGGSMKKYRLHFLQRLADMEDHDRAKELWDVTVYAMKVQERYKWEELPEELKRVYPSQDLDEELKKQKITKRIERKETLT